MLTHRRSAVAKKIDPLNKKNYSSVSVNLNVADIKSAVAFYQKALGFAKRDIMTGPDRKPIHAELTLRGTTLMLSPENPQLGARSAKAMGGSPVTLYLLTENVDKVVATALKLGATCVMPVTEMFWGDRVGTITDPEGNPWMIATHQEEPTPADIKKKMKEQM